MKTGTNNQFPSHFLDFIAQLNENQVEYLLIGGYAMGAYGHIRGTNDLDIFINATKDNAAKMIKACIGYGIPGDSLHIEMFLFQKMVGIGDPPLRIEILKKLDVVDFQFAYHRRRKVQVDNLWINVISLDDLVLLKQAAIKDRNESKDLEDLSFLEKLKKGSK